MKAQIITAALAVFAFASCKKDSDGGNPTVTVPGYWKGWWNAGSGAPQQNMSVLFRAGGSARILYGYVADTATASFKSEGSWQLDGDVVRFTYKEATATFIHRATLSTDMQGTWGASPSEVDGGLWGLTKQ